MFLVKIPSNSFYRKSNFTYSVLKETFKKLSSTHFDGNVKLNNKEDYLDKLINKYESRVLYNSIIESKRLKLGYKKNRAVFLKMEKHNAKLKEQLASIQPIPLVLKDFVNTNSKSVKEDCQKKDEREDLTHFPYSNSESVVEQEYIDEEIHHESNSNIFDDEIRKRYELMKSTSSWMTAYDNYEYDLENDENVNDYWKINYGTPDPKSDISKVPCGGCGALLHCKDTAIPGYIPSEIFKNCGKDGSSNLAAVTCQRCYFLKEYNLALQVRVSPDDYPKVLTTIREKRALVVLMVDLTDFPCSIWPGVADILGPKMPIVVVGNKVDLLPSDGKNFFKNIKENLLKHVKLSGFGTCNILHVALISSKTGFGIEELITSLHTLWKFKGDVYLVGCTNVGKSSLFNFLLQSDYCKVQAADLIQRATTSPWPGTTLNLLKFPIMRPSGQRQYLRHQRLQAVQRIATQEKNLRRDQSSQSSHVKYATLIGHIGRTVVTKEKAKWDERQDFFTTAGHSNATGKLKLGISEKDPQYAFSRWCFDTPGVVQPDQILHILTAEELVTTIPKCLIRPETFCIRPGTSLFIAGLARLDYLEGPATIRLTVFRSSSLPITVCSLKEADAIYSECIGTDLFKVPTGERDRLAKWPGLQSSNIFSITGTDWKVSSNDVVLSSAGWIAVNCAPGKEHKFQAWTPEGRGIHVRDCILPRAVTLRGPRIRRSVAYKSHKFLIN